MIPARHDITVYAGSYFSLPVQWMTGDPATPVDMAGCSLVMHIRKTATSIEMLYELSTSNNRIRFVDATIGKFEIVITGDESKAFTFFRGVYDIEIHWPTGSAIDCERLMQGDVIIDPNVTRGV